jgi:hypothetical protein
MRYAALPLLVIAAACTSRGTQPTPATPPAAEATSWTTTMLSNRNVVPAIAEGARTAGCGISDEKEASFVAVCGKHVVFCKQRGREVVRGCGAPTTYLQCKQIWEGVIEEIPLVQDAE